MWNSELNFAGLLALRAAALVIGSWLICRLLVSSRAKAIVWRCVPLGMLSLVMLEITGLGQVLIVAARLPWLASPERVVTPAVLPEVVTSERPGTMTRPPIPEADVVAAVDTNLSRFLPPTSAAAPQLLDTWDLAWEAAVAEAEEPAEISSSHPNPAWPNLPVAWLWALGTIICLVRYLASKFYHGVCFLRRGAPEGDPSSLRRLQHVQTRLGMHRSVKLRVHPRVSTPVAFGVLCPTIVVPRNFSARYQRDEQDAILAHELAHLMACDSFWQQLSQLVTSLFWWHPGAWFAHQQLHLSIELAADEASLRLPDGPDRLADCLVKVGRDLIGPPTAGMVGVSGRGHSALARRVRRLIELSNSRCTVSNNSQRGIALLMIFVLFSLSALLPSANAGAYPSSTAGENPMQMLHNSWRQSLAAVALASLLAPPAVVADEETETVTITDDGRVEVVVNKDERDDGDREQDDVEVEVEEFVITDDDGQGPRREVRIRKRRNPSAEERSALDAVDRARRVTRGQTQWFRLGESEVHEEIERLHRRLAELQRGPGREESARAVQQRVRQRSSSREQYLRAAVENLRAAGLHELAEQAEARLREDAEMTVRRRPTPTSDFLSERPTSPSSQSPKEVQQLRQQMQQMQHQMQAMDRMMRELLEQRERRSRDEGDFEERAEEESRR